MVAVLLFLLFKQKGGESSRLAERIKYTIKLLTPLVLWGFLYLKSLYNGVYMIYIIRYIICIQQGMAHSQLNN